MRAMIFFSVWLTLTAETVSLRVAFAQAAGDEDPAACLVVDPTSTPLNVRTAPQGPVVGTVANGQPVRILRQTKDPRGRPWAFIAGANSLPIGWVFREYLVCR